MRLFSAYARLFSLPRFRSSLFAAIAGKLQPGVFSLALLLEVDHYRGMERAAVVVSLSALGSATVPLRGRLMDRHGYARVMCPALVLYLIALTGLVLNDRAHGSLIATAACAMAASACAPPVQIVTRLMWRSVTTGDLRTTILSLDAVLTDVGFIVGPALAAFLVTAVAPWAGLAASALLSTSGTLLLVSRRIPHQQGQQAAERDRMGPLRSVPLRRTMAAAVLFFLAVRAIELAFPAWAQEHDTPLMSGVLLSCMGLGSVVGGLVLGALPPSWSSRAELSVTLAAMSLGALLVAAASQAGAVLLAVMAAVMGLALGPTFVAVFATAGDLSPAHMAAETQSWVNSFMSLGGAVGTTVASLIAQSFGPGAVLVVAAASMAAASGLARLVTRPSTVRSAW